MKFKLKSTSVNIRNKKILEKSSFNFFSFTIIKSLPT